MLKKEILQVEDFIFFEKCRYIGFDNVLLNLN